MQSSVVVSVIIEEVGTGHLTVSSSFVQLVLCSRSDKFRIETEAGVMHKAGIEHSMDLELSTEVIKQLKIFPLADPVYMKYLANLPEIDLLFDDEHFWKYFRPGSYSVAFLQICKMQFGRIVGGKTSKVNKSISALTFIKSTV